MNIPFIGGLFSSKASAESNKMSYPVQKSDDEWRAVLNKGKFIALTAPILYIECMTTIDRVTHY
jgi:hypothetical protein